jgi:hypothetical protein
MIRGVVVTLLLLAAGFLAVEASQFEKLHLAKVERSINLAGAYPIQIDRLLIHAD